MRAKEIWALVPVPSHVVKRVYSSVTLSKLTTFYFLIVLFHMFIQGGFQIGSHITNRSANQKFEVIMTQASAKGKVIPVITPNEDGSGDTLRLCDGITQANSGDCEPVFNAPPVKPPQETPQQQNASTSTDEASTTNALPATQTAGNRFIRPSESSVPDNQSSANVLNTVTSGNASATSVAPPATRVPDANINPQAPTSTQEADAIAVNPTQATSAVSSASAVPTPPAPSVPVPPPGADTVAPPQAPVSAPPANASSAPVPPPAQPSPPLVDLPGPLPDVPNPVPELPISVALPPILGDDSNTPPPPPPPPADPPVSNPPAAESSAAPPTTSDSAPDAPIISVNLPDLGGVVGGIVTGILGDGQSEATEAPAPPAPPAPTDTPTQEGAPAPPIDAPAQPTETTPAPPSDASTKADAGNPPPGLPLPELPIGVILDPVLGGNDSNSPPPPPAAPSSTDAPSSVIGESSAAPTETPSGAAVVTSSESTTNVPVESSAEPPVAPPVESSVQASAESSIESRTETPTETSSVEGPPEASSVEASVETSSVEAPTDTSSVEAPAETSVDASAGTLSENPVKETTVEKSAPEASISVEGSSVDAPAAPTPEASPVPSPVEPVVEGVDNAVEGATDAVSNVVGSLLSRRAFNAVPIFDETTGNITGVKVTDLSDNGSSDEVTIDRTCALALALPYEEVHLAQKEDLVLVGYYVWLFGLAFVAIINESIPHLVAAFISSILAVAWSAFQVIRTHAFQSQFDRFITEGACKGVQLIPSYWKQRTVIELPSLVLNCVFALVLGAFSFKLVNGYRRSTSKLVGGEKTVGHLYKIVLVLSIIIQITMFLIIASLALWVDQLFEGTIASLSSTVSIFKGIAIVALLLAFPWFIIGWIAVRRENRMLMAVFFAVTTLFIAALCAMFGSDAYRLIFSKWPLFGALSVASFFGLVISLGLSVVCRMRFGQGLASQLAAHAKAEDEVMPWDFSSNTEKAWQTFESIPVDNRDIQGAKPVANSMYWNSHAPRV